MAAEYSANATQTVPANQAVIFSAGPFPCNQGMIFHRPESGNFLLANNAPESCGCTCGCRRRVYETVYGVSFHANIAIPEGGTLGEIQLSVAIDGDADPSSTMLFTPTVVADDFGNVGADVLVRVPSLCGCESVSIRNTSDQAILVQNANIVFTYEGVRRVF